VRGPDLVVAPSGAGVGLIELIGVGLVSLLLWRITKSQESPLNKGEAGNRKK